LRTLTLPIPRSTELPAQSRSAFPSSSGSPRDVDGDPPPMPMLDVTPAPEAVPVCLVGDDPEAEAR
jgi:hypothetical protein